MIDAATGHVAGVDEVGRGPLAGNVVAAAVVLDPASPILGLRDSKQLSESRRQVLSEEIRHLAVAWSIASASVEEIDEMNILHATMLAMSRAVNALVVPVGFVYVDGNRLPELPCPGEAVVKGDSKIDEIKAASIIAKVERDAEMVRLDKQYPGYGLARNKGYPTFAHREALRELGPSPVHRLSFAPCRVNPS